MAEFLPTDPLDRLLSGMAVACFLFAAAIIILKGFQREDKKAKYVLIGFGFWILGAGVTRIFGFFMYYYDFESIEHRLITQTGMLSLAIAGMIGSFFLEFALHKTRYLIPIMTIIWVLSILLSLPYWGIINTSSQMISMIYFIFIFYDFLKLSDKELKPISLMMISGIIFNMWGSTIETFWSTGLFPTFLTPLFQIIASMMAICPFLLNPTTIIKTQSLWIGLAVITIILSIIFSLFFLIFFNLIFTQQGDLIILIIYLLMNGYVVVILLISIKNIIRKENFEIKSKKNILEMFTRPKNLSVEDVTVSKERKVCLVCKGEVQGFNSFICKCDALYCQKCAKTLSTLENACWSCNSPFDPSKPVRKFDEESKESEISIKQQHKKKEQ